MVEVVADGGDPHGGDRGVERETAALRAELEAARKALEKLKVSRHAKETDQVKAPMFPTPQQYRGWKEKMKKVICRR